MQASRLGFLVLLVKLGPKLWPVLLKMHDALWAMVKSLFGIKGVGIAGSIGLYTYLFTWQMGVALVVFIAIHEYGHLWAMKQCGIKTKGMFFIPGFGAVAVAEERFGNARNEAYIAIMGPVFGLVGFVLPILFVYLKTSDPLWAAVAAIMTFINLINLLPVNPLDGGRILKAVAYSKRHAASLAITVGVSLVTAVLGITTGFSLLVYMAFIGLWEITEEFGIRDHVKKFLFSIGRGLLFTVLFLLVVSLVALANTPDAGILDVGILIIVCMALLVLFLILIADVWHRTIDDGYPVFYYPFLILLDFWDGIKEIFRLRTHHVKPIKDYASMETSGKMLYSFLFLALVAVHVVLIFFLGQVPGAELARELMQ